MTTESARAKVDLATRDDVPAIVAIANASAEASAANFATEPEPVATWLAAFDVTAATSPWLVTREEGRVTAFARAAPHRTRGAYAWTRDLSVYVAPGEERRGLGARLYEALIPTLRRQGVVTLMAGVALPNPASVGLHALFGFAPAGVFPRVGWKHGAWRDVAYYALGLAADADAPPRPTRPVSEAWLALALDEEPLSSADAGSLIAGANAELSATYPEPGATHFDLDSAATAPGVGAFVIGRVDGVAVGCGAIRRVAADAFEVKRMYVRPEWRGRGVSARVLAALEWRARRLGATRLLLETGVRQAAAIGLYRGAGFSPVAAFGEYVDAPLSLCMEKRLRG